jgi:hypothetical protein
LTHAGRLIKFTPRVPITPFLAGQPFEPDDIETMSEACVVACEKLRLTDRADPFTEIVAKKIIEFAQRGIRDRDALIQQTLSEFNVPEWVRV